MGREKFRSKGFNKPVVEEPKVEEPKVEQENKNTEENENMSGRDKFRRKGFNKPVVEEQEVPVVEEEQQEVPVVEEEETTIYEEVEFNANPLALTSLLFNKSKDEMKKEEKEMRKTEGKVVVSQKDLDADLNKLTGNLAVEFDYVQKHGGDTTDVKNRIVSTIFEAGKKSMVINEELYHQAEDVKYSETMYIHVVSPAGCNKKNSEQILDMFKKRQGVVECVITGGKTNPVNYHRGDDMITNIDIYSDIATVKRNGVYTLYKDPAKRISLSDANGSKKSYLNEHLLDIDVPAEIQKVVDGYMLFLVRFTDGKKGFVLCDDVDKLFKKEDEVSARIETVISKFSRKTLTNSGEKTNGNSYIESLVYNGPASNKGLGSHVLSKSIEIYTKNHEFHNFGKSTEAASRVYLNELVKDENGKDVVLSTKSNVRVVDTMLSKDLGGNKEKRNQANNGTTVPTGLNFNKDSKIGMLVTDAVMKQSISVYSKEVKEGAERKLNMEIEDYCSQDGALHFTYRIARRIGIPQGRANGIQGKFYAKANMDLAFDNIHKAFMAQIEEEGAAWAILGNPDNVQLIAEGNVIKSPEFKYWGKLYRQGRISLPEFQQLVIDAFSETTLFIHTLGMRYEKVNTSVQIWSKLPEVQSEYLARVLSVENFRGDPSVIGHRTDALGACLGGYKDAIGNALFKYLVVQEKMDQAASMIERGNIKIEGDTLKLHLDDTKLSSGKDNYHGTLGCTKVTNAVLDRLTTVLKQENLFDHLTEAQKNSDGIFAVDTACTVHVVELEERLQALYVSDEYVNATEEERAVMVEAEKIFIAIKYPSMGAQEYVVGRVLTIGEAFDRIMVRTDINIKVRMEMLISLFVINPFTIILPAYDWIKNKLAGLDADGDAVSCIFNKQVVAIMANNYRGKNLIPLLVPIKNDPNLESVKDKGYTV